MTSMRRLKAVGGILALAAIVTTSHVWGEPAQRRRDRGQGGPTATDQSEETLADDLANAKFAKGGVLTYHTAQGETLFALQLKPALSAAPARPRDYLIMVDTSASQAKGPLAAAIRFTETLISQLADSDRASIWTVNIPSATTNLSRRFQPRDHEALRDAISSLKQEVPLGDTDLKGGLKRAIASFERAPGRQQAIVFLGDGMSIHDPITAADRSALCEEMVKNDVAFYPVPVGPRFDPANLHGLATPTGGEVVRFQPKDSVTDAVKKLNEALAVPVLHTQSHQLGANVIDSFPTTLPPLRGDAPTLIVGHLKAEGPVSYKLEGSVAGQEIRVEGTAAVTDSDPDNFFLVSMVEQWKNNKDQPAATRADRVLAYAYEQTKLAEGDLLAQAEWALGQDKLEAARGLFAQAKKLDPENVEADAGLKIVEKLKTGAINKEQLQEQLAAQDKAGFKALAQANPQPPPPPQVAPPTEKEDLMTQARRRLAVEEQRVTTVVDEAQRQARRLLSSDPDAARDLLKRTYASVRDNPDLSDKARQTLSNRLEDSLRNAEVQGARIKQDREREAQALADSRRRFDLDQARLVEQERTRARLQRFSTLMNQARYEDAYQLALAVIQDAQNSGRPVPVAATAAYYTGLTMNNLSQLEELRRVREERWLLVLMQVERSHVPFPDEPPIQFPPAQVWRELSKLRKEKYENSGFTDTDPVTLRKMREMREKLNKTVDLEKGIEANTPLKDALEFLSDRYQITILVDSAAFKSDLSVDAVEEQPVKLPKMTGVSLATVLRMITAQINGTFMVRRDFIEITTGQRMIADKVIRVYPVADLITPIPNSFNQRIINQSLSIFGTAPGLGLQLGSPAALGGIGAGVGLGAGLGALGAGLGFGGGLGGLGVGGAGGGGFGGIPGANAQGGQVNLGFGGGNFGIGGGQLGQFGNLGGQFGLQGGDQSTILVSLIRQVVGTQREWAQPGYFQRPAAATGPVNPAGQQQGVDDDEGERLAPELLNSVGYYPPARALVVKGTSRFHTDIGGGLLSARPGGQAALGNLGDGKLVIRPKSERDLNKPAEALALGQAAGDKRVAATGKKKNSAANPGQLARLDPKKIWEDALAKGVTDPGLIIACVDFLAQQKRYDHVVEFLKADLRQGIVVRPWVYEALGMALEASGGSPEMVERAYASAVDMEPQDAAGYVRASKAMGDRQHYDRAVAYCRQAALLEPNSPASYEEALMYADLAQDSTAMQWAAGNLLRRDWPGDNKDLHEKAGEKLRELADRMKQARHAAEAERMVKSVDGLRERDLVIEMTWQGEADLDLEVAEPIGTVCSFLQRQTPGGGTLVGDTLADVGRESYVAARAFPGEYQITLRRIWGRPLGGKANLEIIEHMGTPRETHRRQTIEFDRTYTMALALADGRRVKTEYVPPPAPTRKPAEQQAGPTPSDRVLTKLRGLADPEFTGTEYGVRGGAATLGATVSTPPDLKAGLPQDVVYQTKVAPVVNNGTDFTMQVSVSPQDGTTRLKLSPVFQTVDAARTPTIHNPYLPDSGENSAVQ
jgi:tetratricopeptide (TPR) repeat protein